MTDRIGDIHIARDGFVATVTIDKPPINAVSVDLMRDLADALEGWTRMASRALSCWRRRGRCSARALILSNRTSEGPIPERSINPLYDQAVRLFSTELPIVAAVQGAAVGAGLGLALVADFRVASPRRVRGQFREAGLSSGLWPDHTLPRLIGRHNAERMFLRASAMKRRRRMWMGLVDQMVDPPEPAAGGAGHGGGAGGERAAGDALNPQDAAR
jgi:enoyl-CoA hydratase/carnithine racemase